MLRLFLSSRLREEKIERRKSVRGKAASVVVWVMKGEGKKGKRVLGYAGACASGLPSPDDSVVDLSLHGREKCWGAVGEKR